VECAKIYQVYGRFWMTEGPLNKRGLFHLSGIITLFILYIPVFFLAGCGGRTGEDTATVLPQPSAISTPAPIPSSTSGEISLLDLPQINSGDANSMVELYDIELPATTLAFSADGSVLAVGTQKDGLVLFNIRTLSEIRRIPTGSLIIGLDFSPDGSVLAAVADIPGEDGRSVISVMLFETATWNQLKAANMQMETATDFNRDSGEIFRGVLQVAADHRVIFTDGHESRLKDSRIYVFSLEGGDPQILLQIQVPRFTSCWGADLMPDGSMLFAGGRFYDMGSGNIVKQLLNEQDRVTVGAVSPDGSMVAYSSLGTNLVHVDLSMTMSRKVNLDGLSGKVLAIDFSPDSAIIAASSRNGDLILWDVANGGALTRLEGTSATVFSPKGNLLASILTSTQGLSDQSWKVALYGLPGAR